MARWEPGARERLSAAALELVDEQGFDDTTTAQVAARAGLSERTFFRHFADKREALFAGGDRFEAAYVDAVVGAPQGASPWAVLVAALEGGATFFPDERREHSRRRDRVISSHPALRERELLKLAGLARSVAAAMRERGVDEPTATLAGESCVTVFRVAFERWLRPDETRGLAALQSEALDHLTGLAPQAPGSSSTSRQECSGS
ncbi:TetR family transcriptional regulator [Nocardioides sp. YIM 123512]|uniref:TetR family transcriptional regulator n=1 Tax=Nocardioides flavescens TaxID=2691959 RepID=A0A6L7EQU6_9ACTN|nr:TetR family transcriptional regulator [Nocardioides flavescens]